MTVMGLQRFVESSALSPEDRGLWLRALEVMDDEGAGAILEAVTAEPEELELLTRNLKSKHAALAGGDRDAIAALVQQEASDIVRP